MSEEFDPKDLLYRAVSPDNWLSAERRPISGAFKKFDLSVDWSRIHTPQDLLNWWIAKAPERGGSRVAEFEVSLAFELKQQVVHDPLLDDPPNPAHTLVKGRKTGAITRKLAKSVRMAIEVKPD